MCLLVLLVGDDSKPMLIANNRDEYFGRPAERGRFLPNSNTYSPTDTIGNGTWIQYDASSNRFAVVLNFHEWRIGEVVSERIRYKSRGLLPQTFVKGDMSPLTFVQSLIESEREYRGYNIVVGDSSGTFFSSNYCPSGNKIIKLAPGHVYALSNGEFDDPLWVKATESKAKLESILEYHNVFRATTLAEEVCTAMCLEIIERLLSERTPLADPSLGDQACATLRQLAAPFVAPTVIGAAILLPWPGVSDEGGGGRGSESKKLPPPLPEIPPEAYATTDKLFGTRTSTVIFSANMAVAPNLVSPSQTPRKPKSEGCSDGSPSADLKTTSTPSMEARTMQRVLIVERDLNVAEGTWSTNIHRHPLAPAPLTSGEEDEVEGWCHGTGAMPLIPPVTLGYGVKGEVADD